MWYYYEEIANRADLRGMIPIYKQIGLSRKCEQVSVCAYCPTIEKRTIVKHLWGDSVWNTQDARYYHECLHCGKVEKLPV